MIIMAMIPGCGKEKDVSNKIGIIGAMDEEVESLKKEVANAKVTSIAGMEFYEGTLDGASIPADEDMRKNAVNAVKECAPEIGVFEGRVCTGDQFIASDDQKKAIMTEVGGLCCEMEGGAIVLLLCVT